MVVYTGSLPFITGTRKYNVPIDELLKLNNKTDFILSIGQQVSVK
ncbi:MAG: hypothetical protein WC150_15115 [Bacteroidia bacterium]